MYVSRSLFPNRRRSTQRFLFDLVFDSRKLIQTNELICLDIDAAIESIDNYHLELHGEGAPGPDAIELREPGADELILRYTLHLDAVTRGC